jgi:hypothetical protein
LYICNYTESIKSTIHYLRFCGFHGGILARKTAQNAPPGCGNNGGMENNIIDTFITIENAAHAGAFGTNQQPVPTEAQCRAGNYKVGRGVVYGLPIAIEQPRHSYRTGIGADGKRWTNRMAAHYGYFSKTKGADGDPVDCFIGYYPQSEHAWIINQHINGQFDEHKVMICFPDEESARRAYQDSYDENWAGLHSIVKASIDQLKWWLKNGNTTKPLLPAHLPYEGYETMNQRVTWDATQKPEGMTLDKVLYEIRRADAGANLVMDAVTMADILEGANEIMTLDALTSPYAKLSRKMEILQSVMERAGGAIKPVAMQLSAPFKQNGVAQVAAVFELSDGQTVSIFFHNPDVNPKKITGNDELISWKWLLNKKDITIVVAPEKGQDLNVKAVAERIIKLAEKNSAAFQRANTKRAENLAAIESLKAEIPVLEKQLADAQHELEAAKMEADDKESNEIFAKKQANEAFGQFIMKSLIDDFGWKNQGIGETLSLVTKEIGGGMKGGAVNPDGIRRLAARVYDTTLGATHGDNILVEVDLNMSETSEQNAKRLDDAVNAIDPNYVAPVTVPEIDWSKAQELDTDAKIQALGIAIIDEIGGENVYIEKDGMPYYMKPGNTDKYSVGEHDFSNEVVFGDGTVELNPEPIEPTAIDPLASARERLNSDEFKKLTKTFAHDLGTIKGIDEGIIQGYTRSLFVNSVTGKLNRMAAKDPELVGMILAWIHNAQKDWKKPAIAAKNGVWGAVEAWEEYLPLFAKAEEAAVDPGDEKSEEQETETDDDLTPATSNSTVVEVLSSMATENVPFSDALAAVKERFTPEEITGSIADGFNSLEQFYNSLKTDQEQEKNPSQAHIDTLQAIVDGSHDGDDLMTLLDTIDAAATALIDAGLGEQYDDLIGKAAEKWALNDKEING